MKESGFFIAYKVFHEALRERLDILATGVERPGYLAAITNDVPIMGIRQFYL